jgi:agmatine/peptidylarginine deiminase
MEAILVNWFKSVKIGVVVFLILSVMAAMPVGRAAEYDQLLPKGETAEEVAIREAGLWPLSYSDDESEALLPKGETEEEKRMRELGLWPVPQRWEESAPLYDPVSMAEHWPMAGILIRFTGNDYLSTYEGLIREAQEVGLVWIWLSSSSQQTTVTNRINNWGIPMTNIRFLVSPSDSIWMRDYGPLWVFDEQGEPEIINFNYDRPQRPNDNNFPVWLGGHWDIPVYTTNMLYEGGNFIADGCGTCFATNRLYEQNAHQYTPAQVDQIMLDYFGCEQLIILTKMIGDGTGHIDMFTKLLDENTLIVNQVAPGNTNYTILENNAAFLETLTAPNGEPYNVVRIPMGNNFRTYTNSLIVNNKVIVPTYNISLDSTALALYESLMPGYDVVGVDSSSIINLNGAIHCITMGVPLPCPVAPAPDYPDLYYSGTNEITLTWPDVPDAEGFRIYRSEIGCDPEDMIFIGETWTTEFIDDTIDEEFTYYYRVSSFTYCRESSLSECVFTEFDCLHHGDVDFNGVLTAGDAQLIFQFALGIQTPTYLEACAADCNADGVITAADSQIVFLASLGIGSGCFDPTD